MSERVSSEQAQRIAGKQFTDTESQLALDLLDSRARVKELEEAGLALYYAGFWTCDRKADEAALWERLRNALDLPAGTSPPRILRGETP